VAHRKEQKAALRKEREERERKAREAKQRKQLVGYGAGGLLVLAVVAVLAFVGLGGDEGSAGGGGGGQDVSELLPGGGSVPEQKEFEIRPAANTANCRLRSVPGSGTQQHTQSLDERIKYDTNPPSSGRHYVIPAEDGAYSDPPSDEELVHGLEHGRVIIWFKPGLPEDQRAELKALYDEDTYQMFMVPRRNMPYAVAATAWNAEPAPNGTGRMLLCNSFSPDIVDALRAFRDEHRSQGPEPVP
jgi:Protein of unknown function (DUF3105)